MVGVRFELLVIKCCYYKILFNDNFLVSEVSVDLLVCIFLFVILLIVKNNNKLLFYLNCGWEIYFILCLMYVILNLKVV